MLDVDAGCGGKKGANWEDKQGEKGGDEWNDSSETKWKIWENKNAVSETPTL